MLIDVDIAATHHHHNRPARFDHTVEQRSDTEHCFAFPYKAFLAAGTADGIYDCSFAE